MNLAAFGIYFFFVACHFTNVTGFPVGHLTAMPSSNPPSSPQPTTSKKTQEDYNKICQEKYNSTDYVFEPVQEVCIPCSLCVDSRDQYCEVCNKPTTTVPSLVETPSTPNDSSVTFWESTTKHLQTPETESTKTGEETTPDESPTSGLNIVLLIGILCGLIVVILFGLVGFCLIKQYKRVADTQPAVNTVHIHSFHQLNLSSSRDSVRETTV